MAELTKKEMVNGARKASRDSIKRAFTAGVTVTIQRGKKILRCSSDGSERELRTMDFAYRTVKKKNYSLR